MARQDDVGVVAIGRNEGERLRECLSSLDRVGPLVYVDSGSTDGSPSVARQAGIEVVDLTAPPCFSAARSRNAGLERLLQLNPTLRFVQMIDGDCVLAPGWIAAGRETLDKNPSVAAVFGRLRERYPHATIYNMACDDEWNVPVGEARSCGGVAMLRVAALVEAGGYTDHLIAGEEPDLCLRLRQLGWSIRRIDAEMSRHDAAIARFSQWWTRTRRAGHAFAELVYRHRRRSDPSWVRDLVSAVSWAMVVLLAVLLVPLGLLLGWITLVGAAGTLAVMVALQGLRLVLRRWRNGLPLRDALAWTYLIMLGKLAQLHGVLSFCRRSWTNSSPRLIEYKS